MVKSAWRPAGQLPGLPEGVAGRGVMDCTFEGIFWRTPTLSLQSLHLRCGVTHPGSLEGACVSGGCWTMNGEKTGSRGGGVPLPSSQEGSWTTLQPH